jgi:hypothetical protein
MGGGNGRIQEPNRAFSYVKIQPNRALKNNRKTPFIQELMDRDFALGASRLSWHK